ncbi:phosphate ABC transporter substrate-binding protein [Cyanobacterium stanieri LEGE 03274]|uniref:Phosphate ABC transporter substrate-binding protein n=1 Tax=Cyanobacterium stanieri LEGE 03274 TaxID=1828756 RepID=A0ABR9V6Q4_9CHRO|nr:phosphate ABC transporter substrate-binding protein [Cyanobacterium stanieri]MBE9222529.1 phosphate ABC transporter substrate-binding protein [Cyanobacterium stanieri LEGE 03274]
MISKKAIQIFSLGIIAPLTLQSCQQNTVTNSANTDILTGRLIITGSSTVAPLVSEIGKKFEGENPDVRIDVQTGGSSRGISDVRNGIADIGMVSRGITPEEDDLSFHSIAQDGVGIIIHQDNPIDSLSDEQVKQIFTGEISNWQEVGGKDAPITVVNKAEGRSTLELFLDYFVLTNSQIKPSVVIGDNQQGIKTVEGNSFAIGYVSIGTAEFSINNNVPIKLLPLDEIGATRDNVANGSFPLSRPLNLVTNGEEDFLTQTFINYSQSAEVHDLIKKQDFVTLSR